MENISNEKRQKFLAFSELFEELFDEGIVLCPVSDAESFIDFCHSLGVVVNGGALSMNGRLQYLYV